MILGWASQQRDPEERRRRVELRAEDPRAAISDGRRLSGRPPEHDFRFRTADDAGVRLPARPPPADMP
ncbi:hypothetical protein CKAH01_03343 [Colletotrichum kahawae]|uniref:Uncharacterized protein n=1 Tax=Colletotrichum kahawae TaxID=34407 RepID=A0AAD9YRX8_COLKA|nr:hypothetical protein CKAH01_03343 [Colletotrichum kahawae]